MAQQVITRLTDDLEPGLDAVETVEFAIDGRHYEIDLSEANASELRGRLVPFVGAARPAAPTARRASGRRSATTSNGARPTGDRTQSKAIRDWARSQGLDTGKRGRIPTEIVEKFNAAHGMS